MGRALALLLVLIALLGAGCGSGTDGSGAPRASVSTPLRGAAARGQQTFSDAGCSDCHTLAAAGAEGRFGPNLDDSDVSFRDAYAQIRDGGGGMPSFEDRLSPREIANVARFVVAARGG
jgi:cytochrome c6